MSLTPSRMMPLGTCAEPFELVDTVSGTQKSLAELKSETTTVIAFICNHCPYVKHIQAALVALAKVYQVKGVRFVAISSNDATLYPQDGPEYMKVEAQENAYTFPYLYDETQAVARAYGAACTPDFFVFDGALACVYRGRFDASSPGNGKPVTGGDLSRALDALLAGKPVDTEQYPSMGCNIKWSE